MFRVRDQFDDAPVRGHSPAALVADQVIVEAPGSPDQSEPRLVRWRRRVEDWCARIDLAPDLASDIGSKRWLRGAGTMLGLSVSAISLWPDFSQVEAAAMVPELPAVRDEFRSQMIMPLALGADSGRHMGATSSIRPLNGAPERPTLQLVATLGQGDSFERMLARAGVGQADIAQVGQLVGTAMPASAIAAGTQFDISLGRRPQPGAPRVLQSIDFRARFDLDLTVSRQGSGLALVRRPIATDATPLRIRGMVGSSLYRSARNAGAPIAAIQSYLRAIDSQVSLESELAPGDAFDIVVAYKRSAKGERQLGDLLYAGLERGGKPRLQLLRWGAGGQMVAAAGLQQPSESRTIGAPVAGHITSTYGMRRHPILGFTRMHAGIDFGASYGSPIFAVADGIVSFAGRHGGHGNYVRLDHGGGNGTGYGHMSRIAVAPGSRVRAGQVIGYVGSTGLSTGPHLHFEAYQGGRTVNPMGLRFVARPQIDVREASAFKQRLAQILAIRPGAALGSIVASTPAATGHHGDREIDRLADQRDAVQPLPNAGTAISLAAAGNLPNHN
ncbi:M23 family metallopeptidase [Novosphingobium sp. 9U]|uniref:M23 family metallopeptidase n=1 Tax=Novosphingobium sp. 9U TaxID=2653158 RepID=UPI001F393E73|nr:M23 family metallopeptidase [Novosphingobium sp. 9U]